MCGSTARSGRARPSESGYPHGPRNRRRQVADERVLVVDDELSMREFLAILLEREGYSVDTASSGEDALVKLAASTYDLVLTDLTMPGMDGMELIRQVRGAAAGHPRDVPVVMVTAYGSTESAVEAMKEGASDYVLKPFNNDELRLVIRKALGVRALVEENVQLRRELKGKYGFENIIGTSPAMEAVYDMVRRVKDSRISCLVHGESGTGKELVARAIHYSGPRASKPFVAVNCGAIPETLIESELFGYKKGAFTGANRDKDGFFRAAHTGTLFLDEVGEMPLHAQVKLLRAIAERKVVAVGDTMERDVDVRIVAATNRDLEEEVRAGRFREDLFYRLNVVKIELPPLRARRGDVRLLCDHFVQRYAKEYGKNVRGVADDALFVVEAYSWPGNVRELQNAMEGAVALEQENLVTLNSLPRRLVKRLESSGSSQDHTPRSTEFPPEGVDLDTLLSDFERGYLVAALDTADGNKTKAAKLLGMSFRSFRYRLAKYDMDEG
ncbi:MAG: sigma-54-dependent Fis family transcriptional regulator [Proteobacteria bacterium]|nr:sigma-54-dependent Fis family transcriptional regulator [Pseudomonadota bacterium]MCP4919592.1 sigma-54-dependent Fis family transcriptional regulator [Pseudomonadota bacterium]